MHTQTRTRTHARTCTHSHTHTHTHARTHAGTHARTHTRTQTPVAYQGNQGNETEEKVYKKRMRVNTRCVLRYILKLNYVPSVYSHAR